MIKDDGGPAFPVQDAATRHGHGMTLRDYFAAKAMQAYANADASQKSVALASYQLADEMIKARASK